ncbi:metallophosphoesterase [Rhizobium leguminosarum]|uniref:metallophosphoesterase n=1 Tax=Rhizobium leguminosarum TaxID=384 RepID=UPI00103204DE|nr:metallophosphoesterase [Rhizobium leguminosarum]TBF65674.1 phosphohydrolase [Rhizobium leguminosarum]
MRAWILSDIHHSLVGGLFGTPIKVPDADVCICAGDVSDDITTSIHYLRRYIEPKMPIVLVLGNHDYFGSSISFALETARAETKGTRIHLLEDQAVELSGCRFIGATLWTDFSVSVGDDEHVPPEERRNLAFGLVPAHVADFHCIFRSDERQHDENGMVTVHEILSRHRASRSFIERELDMQFAGPTVVVTHHAPHMRSLDPRFYGQVTSAAFASDLSDLIRLGSPKLWVHGHIHRFRDYLEHRTRIICNPHGYQGERGFSGFQSNFVVEL